MKKILITLLAFVLSPLFASIQIDGNIDDWESSQRLNIAQDLPPSLASNNAIYGTYAIDESKYKFAITSENIEIGPNTTIWLNIDNDTNTGQKIWGEFSGVEYYINIHSDNQPYLYRMEPLGEFVAGPLEHTYSADKKVLELSLDSSLIENTESDISILADINDSIFLPESYSYGDLQLTKEIINLPVRTDFTKRVGIVFSDSSRNNFFDVGLPVQKAYNQLFMTMQYQTMMAGIPFDLLNEDDLTDINKIKNYDTLIMPYFAYVPKDKFNAIKNTLYQAVYSYGIGIITSSDFMTNYADGSSVEGDSYRHMKQLLGITYGDGNGPVSLTLNAKDNTHPVTKDYTKDEVIFKYDADLWYSTFKGVSNNNLELPISTLAYQKVEGVNEDLSAVLAIENNGRHVHFSTLEFLGNTNLLWSAIQWSVYGDKKPVSLKMGRFNNLFISRNDMDQSQETFEVKEVDGALLKLLRTWKRRYGFVGSYFINIGNNAPDQYTDWNYSGPLYKKYIDLGNEIGTHSYTHPHDTNILSKEEIEFEFNQSITEITDELNPTWRDQNIRGAAVPGAPEGEKTALEIIQHVDYLTGGYSSIGAGYPGAIGYLTPDSDKVYLSPNMSFDYSMMEYGIPVYDKITSTWYPQPLTALEAEAKWKEEYTSLMNHAEQPIIHWPWHDYGPTSSLKNDNPYSLAMFKNTIKLAYKDKSEFVTSIDAAQRIKTFKNAKIDVEYIDNDTLKVKVISDNAGKFSVDMQVLTGQKINSVDNWYAYNNEKVFLDKDAGEFIVNLGTKKKNVTRILKLPMRAELLNVEGDSSNLNFTFKGEGKVKVRLKKKSTNYNFVGGDSQKIKNRVAFFTFNSYGIHNVSITLK